MLWLDIKFLNLASFHLKGFVQKKNSLWNARCPICGDSEKSERIKRFYVFPGLGNQSQHLYVKCHNCSVGGRLSTFLETLDPALHREYILERVKEKHRSRSSTGTATRTFTQTSSSLPTVSDDILSALTKVVDLHPDHSARKYCDERKIPEFALNEFRWTDDFKSTAALLNPESAEDLRENDPRIVIPFYDADGDVTVMQGRTLSSDVQPKYITIKMNDMVDKVYGMHRVDKTKPIIVMEGPIDSIFVDNAVATGDSDLTRFKDGSSYVFDNQPRNIAIVKKVRKAIDDGYPVFFWPESLGTGKDINDAVKDGIVNPSDLHSLIMSNTLTGLRAKMAFSTWCKV